MQKIIKENKVVYKKTKKQLSFHDIQSTHNMIDNVDIMNLKLSDHAFQQFKERNITVDDIKETLASYTIHELTIHESVFGDEMRAMIRSKNSKNGLQTCLVVDDKGTIITGWKIELWKKVVKRFY